MKLLSTFLILYLTTQITFGQEFSKNFDSASGFISFTNAFKTNDSGYVVFGERSMINNKWDEIFVKLNSFGDTVFTTIISTNENRFQPPSIVQSLTDSSFYLINSVIASNSRDSIAFLVKLNSLGEIIWQKQYAIQNSTVRFTNIKLVTPDSIFITGTITDGITYANEGIFLKLDTTGAITDQFSFGSNLVNDFIVLPNHNIVFAGSSFDQNTGFYVGTAFEATSELDTVWSYSDGGPIGDQGFEKVIQLANGQFWIVCTAINAFNQIFYSSIYTFDSTGNYLFTLNFNLPSVINTIYSNIQNSSEGGCIISYQRAPAGINAILTIDSTLSISGFKVDPNLSNEFGSLITLPNYTTENFIAGRNKIFKYNSQIDNCHLIDSICVCDTGALHFPFTPYVFPNRSSYQIYNNPGNLTVSHGMIVTNDCLTLSLNESTIIPVEVYPNPADHNLTIHLNEQIEKSSLKIYNTYSLLVKEIVLSNLQDANVDVSNLSPGMYFYSIELRNKISFSGKIIIE